MIQPLSDKFITQIKPQSGLIRRARADAYADIFTSAQLGLFVDDPQWVHTIPAQQATTQSHTAYQVWNYNATLVIAIADRTIIVDPDSDFDVAKYQPDVIIITHAHHDHCGGLWQITNLYPNCDVVMTPATWQLMAIEEPQRTHELMQQAGHQILADGSCHHINGVDIRLYPAGHLLGACWVDLAVADVRILVSGDFSLRTVAHGVSGWWPTTHYNLVLLESTHLFDHHWPLSDQSVNNVSVIEACHAATATLPRRITILATALGNAQDIYTSLLNQQLSGEFAQYTVALHGKATTVTQLAQKVLRSANPIWQLPIQDYDQLSPRQPAIIITRSLDESLQQIIAQGGPIIRQSNDNLLVDHGNLHYRHSLHASFREIICSALAIPCAAVGFYHGPSHPTMTHTVQQLLAACGRATITINNSSYHQGA